MSTAAIALLGVVLAQAQPDPRQHHHGAVVNPFVEHGSLRYLAAWSSSAAAPWEHDIFAQRLHFEGGELVAETAPMQAVGDGGDGAQEPVDAALWNDLFLTAWEDGTEATIDVRALLHDGRGGVVRGEWIVAGGAESQHSAAVASLPAGFLVAYADEAPPAQAAMVEARLFDRTGTERGHLELTPPSEDHWWPVVAGDGERRVLAAWGDGSVLWGSLLTLSGGEVQVQPAQALITGIAQYHYHLVWLDEIARFFVLSRRGSGSEAVLVDREGTIRARRSLPHPVIREARPAARWHAAAGAFKLAYPTLVRDVALLRVESDAIAYYGEIDGDSDPVLSTLRWPATGTCALFAADRDGQDQWGGDNVVLFVANQEGNDDALLAAVRTAAGF